MPNEKSSCRDKSFSTFFIQIASFILLFHLSLCSNGFNFKQLGRSTVSRIINERTSYIFVFDRTTNNSGSPMPWSAQAVPSAGNISVQFPPQYNLAGLTCDKIDIVSSTQSFSPTTYTCVVEGNRAIFSGALSTATDLLIRTVTASFGNVLNPSPAIRTRQFTGYIGVDVAVANGGTALQLLPGSFSQCSLTFGNSGFVNSSAPAIIQITLLNPLNSSSMIRTVFPSYKTWRNDISNVQLPITSSMSCSGLANTQTTPICVGSYTAFSVTASSIFSNVLGTGQIIRFQINNFISPPTLQDADTITITSLTNNFEVDTCTTKVTGLKPKQLTNLTIQPIEGVMKVNDKVGIMINMTFSDTVNELDTFRITFPNSLPVTFNSVTRSGSSEGVSTLINQVLSLSMNVNFQVTYWNEAFYVINFYTMTAPPSIKESDPITVQILRNGFQKMIGTTTVKATQSSLEGTVGPTNFLVNANTLYVFSINLKDRLTSEGWLEIIFPSSIRLPLTITSISASGTSIKAPIATVNGLENKVTVTNLATASFIPIQTFTLTLGLISNPGTSKPTDGFIVKSYYQAGNQHLVATGTIGGITANPGILKSQSITVRKSSDIVLANSVDYVITFLTTYEIPQNGKIKIQIPSDIRIDLANLPSNCFQKINQAGAKIAATCSGSLNAATSKYEIIITSIALTGSLAAGTTVELSFEGICTNPDTTRNILGFSINIFTNDDFLIEGANTGISTRASTPAPCQNVAINRQSKKNSDITQYTISLKQPSNLQPSSFLTFTIPTAIRTSTDTQCFDFLGTTLLSCTIINNAVTATFPPSAIVNNTVFGITLTKIVNTASFQPLNEPFLLSTKTPDNINFYCQSSTPILLENNVPSSFSDITGSFTPRIYNQITSLIIDFKASVRVVPSFLIVSLATNLKVETLVCSFQNVVSGSCQLLTINTVKVSGTFNSNQMQFTIGGIRAPKFKPLTSQHSSVSSFTALNHKIDESINLIEFLVNCTLPCKTCAFDDPTECLSCYHDVTISTETYYLTTTKFCYSICPDRFYENVNTFQCEACNSLCKTCQLSPTNCTSCFADATAKYFNVTSTNSGTCLPLCPKFYYPNALNTCVQCESPCDDCQSQTSCKTCAVGFFMFNGTCRPSCPSGISITNVTLRQCEACSSVCATCSGTVDNCVTCSAEAALFQSRTCVLSCPPPLVINAGQCANCDPSCKQCSVRATNCTRCDTSSALPFLHNFRCLDDCPDTFYKDLVNGVCSLCSSLDMGCSHCSDFSTCISCDPGYVFLSNKCYATTPTGYYNDNGYARECQGECATCVDFATKCTSCKTLNLTTDNTCTNTCPPTFVGQNKICVTCQYPCLTCSNIKTNCTSCALNLTNPVFFSNFYCIPTCPSYTYPNPTTRKCQPCQEPCLLCNSQNSCASCINGRFLTGTQCLPACPDGYVGLNKVCEQCGGNCATCQISRTRCNSCKPSFYFVNSSSPTCISDCSTMGLYPNANNSQCTSCTPPCVTCVNTSTKCTSCAHSVILFQSQCINQCPAGFYAFSNTCVACPSQCAKCTSATICQSCTHSNYLLLNFCVAQCPTSHPVITSDGKCQRCSQFTCRNCNQNDYCLQCMQPFFLHLGKCVQRCPKFYNEIVDNASNTKSCVYDAESAANQTAEENLNSSLSAKDGNLFPVPFIIGSSFVGIATIMSKFQNPFTFISGVLYSLWGLIEWASVALTLYFYYIEHGWQKVQFFIVGGSFAFLYLLNFLAFFIQNIYLMGDMSFKKWLEMGSNRCCYYFCSLVSFLTTHKFKNVLFCKMFNFNFLKGRLDSVQQFRVFNSFSFLSFLSSGGILFGMGMILTTYTLQIDQRLMAYIDATVLTAVNIILGILNSRKDNDFFEQKTEDGYVVNKRIEDYDELLYGTLPMTTELKLDQYEITGKKLISSYETRYHHRLPSEFSQDSVRNISIQAEPILGQQSRITHLNDSQISDLEFFERKEVSIQFDQLPPEMQDKSISMAMRNNQSISIQMDEISRNQISIQVSKQKQEVSIQYAPNVLDHGIGMSREQAQISVQANPNQEEISIQYSAKPVFVNIDQSYRTDHYDQLEESNQTDDSQLDESMHQQSASRVNSQAQNSQSHNQTHLTQRIKKPDALLKPQLELDVNEKLKQRQLLKKKLHQQKIKQERMQAVADFQKKQTYGQANSRDQQQDNPIPKPNQRNRHQVDNFFNNNQSVDKNQSQTIMDSKYDILNPQKQRQFSSNQSIVQSKPLNPNQSIDSQNGGEKTQQQFIEMLSGKKNTESKEGQESYEQQNKQKNNQNLYFNKKDHNKILKVEMGNMLQESNQISLNMTDDLENNQQGDLKVNQRKMRSNFKFENKNQLFDSGSQQYEYNQESPQNTHAQLSKNYTKSISTKNMTVQNRRPPLSKGIQRGQLIDSSQEIQNSLDSENNIMRNIIHAPIQPKINDRGNFRNTNTRNLKQDSSMNEDERNLNFLPEFSKRNLKSATLVRNHQRNNHNNLQEFDDSVDQEDYMEDHEKQQPLPEPERQFGNQDELDELQFGESQKVLVSPLNTEEILSKPPTPHGLPRGVNKKTGKSGQKPKTISQPKNKSMSTNQMRGSSRQKPVYNELLNPSTSIKRNLNKELQKQQRKVQNRKKNLQLMEGMLERPSNSKRGYAKEQDEEKRNQVEKVYLNRQNLPYTSNK